MMEKWSEAGEVSVEVRSGIVGGVEVKEVEVGEIGVECNGKGDGHGDGSEDEVVANGNDDSDNSYVFVSGGDGVVEDGEKRGDSSEVLKESNDSEVLEEFNEAEVLVESERNCESKEDDAESLNEGTKSEDEEVGKTCCGVENGVSLFSKDEVDDSIGEDETKKDIVADTEKVAEESESMEVEKGSKVDKTAEIEYSNKLEDAQEVENGFKVDKTAETEYSNKLEDAQVENSTSDDHECNSQQIINDVVENGDAVLEVSESRVKEKLDSEIETTKPNESEIIAEEMNRDGSEESSLVKKENQESTKDLVSCDAQPQPGLMELHQANPVNDIADPLADKAIDDKETQFSLKEMNLENKSEQSSDVKENENCESLVHVEAHLDFNKEEQNDSGSTLLRESNAEFAYEPSPNDCDDFPCGEKSCVADNDGKNTDSVSKLDESQRLETANSVSEEVHFDSTEQKENGLEYDTHTIVNDNQTPEAEQTLSKDTLLDSIDHEQKELASDINDGQHMGSGTGCPNGPSPDKNCHHLLADDADIITPDADTGESTVPADNEWPDLSYYNTKRKINKESNLFAHRSQESENIPQEMQLAVINGEGHNLDTISSENGNHVGHKEVLDASLCEGKESASPASGTSEVINHIGQSNDESTCPNTGVSEVIDRTGQNTAGDASAENLDNEVAVSESGNNEDETNLNGNVEAPEVDMSPADEVSCQTEEDNKVDRRPFFFMVKVPRFEDDDIKEKMRISQQELDEKSKLRDSYNVQIQTKKAICDGIDDELEAAKLEERAARDSLKAKRQEIDAAQAVIDKVNNAMTVEDIDGNIRNMEHKMQHETIPLSEEKQLMREIKRLKHFRDQLSSTIGTQEELQKALDQKDHIKDHLKSLKRELDLIRSNVQKAETVTQAAKKKSFENYSELKKLKLAHRDAYGLCQKAHRSLGKLRRELAQKNKFFWMYKDDRDKANMYASSGDRDSLHNLCVNQVEMIMDAWNTNDEFRENYVKCNAIRTLRRLKTLDGRSLGIDEEPPSLPYVRNDRSVHSPAVTNSMSQFPSLEQSKKPLLSIAEKTAEEPVLEVVEKKEANKQSKSTTTLSEVLPAPIQELTQEEKEEAKRRKEEEELAKMAEEMRKKEEEDKKLDQLRLEEKAKAKEAIERKKKMAEKAQAMAELRAKREAEQREKEREKRLRKKEKKKSPGAKEEEEGNEKEVEETQAELTRETKLAEKPLTVSKRHHKPSNYPKVTKPSSMPLPLRNRGKRKMQIWMWIGVSSAVAVAVALVWICYLASTA